MNVVAFRGKLEQLDPHDEVGGSVIRSLLRRVEGDDD